MPKLDRHEIKRIASVTRALDRVAITVCEEVGKNLAFSKPSDIDIRFAPGDDTLSFRASVHRVNMLVRYEQIIRSDSGKPLLWGAFIARLDYPHRADQTVISSFLFDPAGNVESAGDVIKDIDDGSERTIRDDLTLLLAHDVQRFIATAE